MGARLAGRSYRQIAADAALRKPGGGAYTRQRVQQLERRAMVKLGLGASLAAAVHAAERADRALGLVSPLTKPAMNSRYLLCW